MDEIVLNSDFIQKVFSETDYDVLMDCLSMEIEDPDGNYGLEMTMRITSRPKERTYVFVNNVHMKNTSTVEVAFRTALHRTVMACAVKDGLVEDEDDIPRAGTIREGVDCIIALTINDEEVSPSADYCFCRPKLRSEFETFYQKNLEEYFAANPLPLKKIYENGMKETAALNAARREYYRVKYNVEKP